MTARVAGLATVLCLWVNTCVGTPERVTYRLGGIVSGPFSVSAELDRGVVIQTGGGREAPSTRSLSPQQRAVIVALASSVARNGATTSAACPPNADAIGRFDIVEDGVIQSETFATPCMNDVAKDLLLALRCGAGAADVGCEP